MFKQCLCRKLFIPIIQLDIFFLQDEFMVVDGGL